MPKKPKVLCVCSLVNKLAIFYGHNLEGEIYFKHSPQCKLKAQGTYEWKGTGYERKNNAD